MAKIQSVFREYSSKLQVVINTSLDRFAPTWYQQYFPFAPTQQTLTFTSIIGSSRIEAAASVVNRSSRAPLRSRASLEKYTGDIPAIKEKFAMSEEDYRDFQTLQALKIDEAAKTKQLLDLLFNDIKIAGSAAHKRLDIMALQAVSTGQLSLTVENNPDGLVLSNPIDLLMPDENKSNAAVKWATSATAKPISDIEKVVSDGNAKGITFAKILMTPTAFANLRKTTEVVDTMKAFYYGPKPGASFNPVAISTLDNINNFLQANRMPVIEIVDQVIGIEKDGKIGTLRPFNDNNVSFIPAGNLGVIKNAFAMEEMYPVEHVNYGVYNRALISKWRENDPWQEFTQVELNACPALEAVDSIFLLTVEF
jgi:hypothetical protein